MEHRTRIRNLDSLENEHYGQLPPEPYVRGYVLEYARALGIRDAIGGHGSLLASLASLAGADA